MIGNPSDQVLAQAVSKLELQLGREINYTVLTPKEFKSRRARKDAFLENVWHNERVPLIGPGLVDPQFVSLNEEVKPQVVDWPQIERFS